MHPYELGVHCALAQVGVKTAAPLSIRTWRSLASRLEPAAAKATPKAIATAAPAAKRGLLRRAADRISDVPAGALFPLALAGVGAGIGAGRQLISPDPGWSVGRRALADSLVWGLTGAGVWHGDKLFGPAGMIGLGLTGGLAGHGLRQKLYKTPVDRLLGR